MTITKDIPQMIVHEPGVSSLPLPNGYYWDYQAEMNVEHRTVTLTVRIMKSNIWTKVFFNRDVQIVAMTRELSRKYHIPRALTSMETELIEQVMDSLQGF